MLVDEKGPIRIDFAPPLCGELNCASWPLAPGECVTARVGVRVDDLGGAFVDLGDAGEGFLHFRKSVAIPTQGSRVAARVNRGPIGSKKPTLIHLGPAEGDAIGRDAAPGGGLVALLSRFDGAFDRLSVDGGDISEAMKVVAEAGVIADADIFPYAVYEEALDLALSRSASLPGAGRVIVDETEGATVVDVDAGGAVGGLSSANDRVNREAAALAFRLLALRSAGGRIALDFLPPSSAGARKALEKRLAEEAGALSGARIDPMMKDGFVTLTAPRRVDSLLRRASETVSTGMAAPGLRLSCAFVLRRALTKAEVSLSRMDAAAHLEMRCGEALYEAVSHGAGRALSRIEARFGARLTARLDPTLAMREFVIHEC